MQKTLPSRSCNCTSRPFQSSTSPSTNRPSKVSLKHLTIPAWKASSFVWFSREMTSGRVDEEETKAERIALRTLGRSTRDVRVYP